MSNYFSFKASSSPRVLLNFMKLFSATKLFSWQSDTNVREADLEISFYLPKINYSARELHSGAAVWRWSRDGSRVNRFQVCEQTPRHLRHWKDYRLRC